MTPGDIGVILGALASVGALLVAYLAYRQSTKKDKQQLDADAIKNAIASALAPLNEQGARADTRMAVLETKVDLMWANLQKNMAKIIHSPDPRRARVDFLMDKLIHDIPMSPDEENETRNYLNTIMHYEPGQSPEPSFPVRDGEQTAAAWLLMSLDYIPIRSTK